MLLNTIEQMDSQYNNECLFKNKVSLRYLLAIIYIHLLAFSL
jgi:hypothetical protein